MFPSRAITLEMVVKETNAISDPIPTQFSEFARFIPFRGCYKMLQLTFAGAEYE